MIKQRIIKPDVINILCHPPKLKRRDFESKPMPEPEPKKKTFWGKIKDFFKEFDSIIAPVVALATAFAAGLNAVSRFLNSPRKNNKKRKSHKNTLVGAAA